VGLFENHAHPGVLDALARLRRAGRTLFLVTVKPHAFASRIVDHFGFAPHLRGIHAPELSESFPDKADLVRKALTTEGIDPSSAIMVGDRAHDVVAARKNGVATVAVTWGYGTRAELESALPDFMVSSVAELLACLGVA
jgi:phosphoglycolate phosphatase